MNIESEANKNCVLCGKKTSLLERVKLNSGLYICTECTKKLNFTSGWDKNTLKISSVEEIEARVKFVKKDLSENEERISEFKANTQFGGLIWFDDEHDWFVLPKGTFKYKIDDCYVFKYEEILSYELLEDGESINKGGLGKALVGGAVFGVAGAVAGGSSKRTHGVCTNIQIKITTTNIDRPVIYVNIIDFEIKKKSNTYKKLYNIAQNVMSKLNIITDELEQNGKEVEVTNTISVTEEIKKFKELLDMGAISQEEFNKQKEKLLNVS